MQIGGETLRVDVPVSQKYAVKTQHPNEKKGDTVQSLLAAILLTTPVQINSTPTNQTLYNPGRRMAKNGRPTCWCYGPHN